MRRYASRLTAGVLCAAGLVANAAIAAECGKPVYLTFDTGHMGVAPLIADVLKRQDVHATFFLANEKTLTGGASLDDQWAPWWKARAADGNVFGSHTFDHVYWVANAGPGKFRVKPSAGPDAGKVQTWTTAQYCASLDKVATRFEQMTGHKLSPIFRSPGGKHSPALLAAAKSCGYSHVGWAPAGFLGDELPSQAYPNAKLLDQALRTIKPGDILLAHLGIWSRQDPWAPAVLEPLIVGLKNKGFCFATLATHPDYRASLKTGH